MEMISVKSKHSNSCFSMIFGCGFEIVEICINFQVSTGGVLMSIQGQNHKQWVSRGVIPSGIDFAIEIVLSFLYTLSEYVSSSVKLGS